MRLFYLLPVSKWTAWLNVPTIGNQVIEWIPPENTEILNQVKCDYYALQEKKYSKLDVWKVLHKFDDWRDVKFLAMCVVWVGAYTLKLEAVQWNSH